MDQLFHRSCEDKILGRSDGQTDGVTALLDLLSPSATQVKIILKYSSANRFHEKKGTFILYINSVLWRKAGLQNNYKVNYVALDWILQKGYIDGATTLLWIPHKNKRMRQIQLMVKNGWFNRDWAKEIWKRKTYVQCILIY